MYKCHYNISQSISPVRIDSANRLQDFFSIVNVISSIDSGHGVLYTSGSDGVVYSESLLRHLYPNFGVIHDFYKVQSMRGVYITSQMSDDNSIHSMITFNRGATWQKIPRPDDAPCKDESKVRKDVINLLHAGKFYMLFCRLPIFFQIIFFSKNSFRNTPECQTVWILIRPDICRA